MSTDLKTAQGQRDQLAYYIVRIAVAYGMIDGQEPYTGEQVAFLGTTLIDAISKKNQQHNPEYAAERQALLDAMPPLRSL